MTKVVDSSMQVNAKLHNRHAVLFIHQAKERFAFKLVGLYFNSGKNKPTDILSKNWVYSKVWTRLKALLFWIG
jgi:hypothetical protein